MVCVGVFICGVDECDYEYSNCMYEMILYCSCLCFVYFGGGELCFECVGFECFESYFV